MKPRHPKETRRRIPRAQATNELGSTGNQAPARRLRLPGFVITDEVGLGDVVKRLTYAMGVSPCGGCETRAAALNRTLVFSRFGKRAAR